MLDVIDLAGLPQHQPAAINRIAGEIGRACRDVGFFYIRNHGVTETLLSRIFEQSRNFFRLPTAAKEELSISRSRHNRGYVGVSSERLNRKQADFKEAFNIGLDLAPSDPEVLANKPFRGVNLWPQADSFRTTALAYFNDVWRLGCNLHKVIASDLGLPIGFFDDKFDRPMATLRLLHYPPREDAKDAAPGAGEHTDYGSITLLLTDDAGGLDVRRRDGTWVHAPPLAGAFVCNIGDCLMRWSNDIYVSTPHRVTSPPDRDRYSVAFFLDPNPEATIDCLPGCSGPDRPAKYPPILAADYLSERLEATYGKPQRP